LPYRNRAIAADTPRTFVIGRNILRFAAFGTGYYCGNTSLAPHLVGAETDARSPQSDRPSVERGAYTDPAGASAGLAAQTEMPNRTSFSEVPAARTPPFGDSRVIEVVKIRRTVQNLDRWVEVHRGELHEPYPGTDLAGSDQAVTVTPYELRLDGGGRFGRRCGLSNSSCLLCKEA
jgi:hypothetical protein